MSRKKSESIFLSEAFRLGEMSSSRPVSVLSNGKHSVGSMDSRRAASPPLHVLPVTSTLMDERNDVGAYPTLRTSMQQGRRGEELESFNRNVTSSMSSQEMGSPVSTEKGKVIGTSSFLHSSQTQRDNLSMSLKQPSASFMSQSSADSAYTMMSRYRLTTSEPQDHDEVEKEKLSVEKQGIHELGENEPLSRKLFLKPDFVTMRTAEYSDTFDFGHPIESGTLPFPQGEGGQQLPRITERGIKSKKGSKTMRTSDIYSPAYRRASRMSKGSRTKASLIIPTLRSRGSPSRRYSGKQRAHQGGGSFFRPRASVNPRENKERILKLKANKKMRNIKEEISHGSVRRLGLSHLQPTVEEENQSVGSGTMRQTFAARRSGRGMTGKMSTIYSTGERYGSGRKSLSTIRGLRDPEVEKGRGPSNLANPPPEIQGVHDNVARHRYPNIRKHTMSGMPPSSPQFSGIDFQRRNWKTRALGKSAAEALAEKSKLGPGRSTNVFGFGGAGEEPGGDYPPLWGFFPLVPPSEERSEILPSPHASTRGNSAVLQNVNLFPESTAPPLYKGEKQRGSTGTETVSTQVGSAAGRSQERDGHIKDSIHVPADGYIPAPMPTPSRVFPGNQKLKKPDAFDSTLPLCRNSGSKRHRRIDMGTSAVLSRPFAFPSRSTGHGFISAAQVARMLLQIYRTAWAAWRMHVFKCHMVKCGGMSSFSELGILQWAFDMWWCMTREILRVKKTIKCEHKVDVDGIALNSSPIREIDEPIDNSDSFVSDSRMEFNKHLSMIIRVAQTEHARTYNSFAYELVELINNIIRHWGKHDHRSPSTASSELCSGIGGQRNRDSLDDNVRHGFNSLVAKR